MSEGTIRVAAVQPALRLGEVEWNLARVDELIRDAHREHSPDVITVPEAMTSPNVYSPKLDGVARPVDGQPFQLLARLARELDCVVGGGFIAARGGDAYGTYVLAEPDVAPGTCFVVWIGERHVAPGEERVPHLVQPDDEQVAEPEPRDELEALEPAAPVADAPTPLPSHPATSPAAGSARRPPSSRRRSSS